ncbi:uncharacterized protein LOC142329235 [Lycorma delicatula]|uniref:uncharacterized protein LOC142329235 n=1 Tax=Lycorma delicatula TaxID=130591 RepID=UPI003F515C55
MADEKRNGCFICDAVLIDVNKKIISSSTSYTNSLIIDKLSHLIGNECIIIVTEDDLICSNCFSLFDQIDKLENDLKNVIQIISNLLTDKYGLYKEITDNKNDYMSTPNKSCKEISEIEIKNGNNLKLDASKPSNNETMIISKNDANTLTFFCNICNCTIIGKRDFNKHIINNHIIKIQIINNKNRILNTYECSVCNSRYLNENTCKQHVENIHTNLVISTKGNYDLNQQISDVCLIDEEVTESSISNIDLETNLNSKDLMNNEQMCVLNESEDDATDKNYNIGKTENMFESCTEIIRDEINLVKKVNIDVCENKISNKVNCFDNNEKIKTKNNTDVMSYNSVDSDLEQEQDIGHCVRDRNMFKCEKCGNWVEKYCRTCRSNNINTTDVMNKTNVSKSELVFDSNINDIYCNKTIFTNANLNEKNLKHYNENTAEVRSFDQIKIESNTDNVLQSHESDSDKNISSMSISSENNIFQLIELLDSNSLLTKDDVENNENHCNEKINTFNINKLENNNNNSDENTVSGVINIKQIVYSKSNCSEKTSCLPNSDKSKTVIEDVALLNGELLITNLTSKNNQKANETNNKFSCSFCNHQFETKLCLKLHVKQQHKNDNLQNLISCVVCRGLKIHEMLHTGKYPFICEFCGKGFISSHILNEHKGGKHFKEFRHICDVCGKGFYFYDTYHKHRKHHDTPYPNQCDICKQYFRSSSRVAEHKRIKHTLERPYKCPYCPSSFHVGNLLKYHLCTHTRQYPHTCSTCNKGFPSRHKLALHMSKKHNDNSLINNRCPNNKERHEEWLKYSRKDN